MPRTARVVSLTGYNHIIARGNGGICIFEDDEDRYRMLTLFEDKLVGNGIGVTAWCLMSNHFHLMVDDPHGKISSCMSGVLTSYAMYFNRKTGRVGHLFQDRFTNIPVENDVQAISLADYIHMNPVKAGISAVDAYRWSSYRAYAYGYDGFGFCDPGIVLDLVGGSLEYRRYLTDRIDQAPYDAEPRPRILDDEALEVAKGVAFPVSLPELASMKPSERRPILCKMRRAGLTINQIVRVVGIGRTSVVSGTTGWNEV